MEREKKERRTGRETKGGLRRKHFRRPEMQNRDTSFSTQKAVSIKSNSGSEAKKGRCDHVTFGLD